MESPPSPVTLTVTVADSPTCRVSGTTDISTLGAAQDPDVSTVSSCTFSGIVVGGATVGFGGVGSAVGLTVGSIVGPTVGFGEGFRATTSMGTGVGIGVGSAVAEIFGAGRVADRVVGTGVIWRAFTVGTGAAVGARVAGSTGYGDGVAPPEQAEASPTRNNNDINPNRLAFAIPVAVS